MGSIGLPTSHHLHPPFPNNVATAPLVSISLSKLEQGDGDESKALYEAARNLGFFYLGLEGSNTGEKIVEEAERLNKIQQEFYRRPQEEREEYAREKIDQFFGYRQFRLEGTNDDGSQKRNETYNMRKDDFVGNAGPLPCHPLIQQNWELLRSYVYDCRSAVDTMLSHLETHLELSPGSLAEIHRIDKRSGDHVRFNQTAVVPFSEEQARNVEHTDFGSITILMNWLGGLQIRLPDTEKWVYVKPMPGSAIVNLGDAMVKLTAGLLRSNVHRVVPPPPPQDGVTRNSLVYFSRPEDSVLMKRLKGGLIDGQPETQAEREEVPMTAQEWTYQRSVGRLQGVYTHGGGLEKRKDETEC